MWGSAQSTTKTPDLSKLHPKTQKAKSTNKSPAQTTAKENSETAVAASQDYVFLRDAVENAFMVVKQSYNVRENGVNVAGNDFFGHVYSIMPIVEYGYIADCYFQEPWKMDRRYDRYSKRDECLASVDLMQYYPLTDRSLKPFIMNTLYSDSLATDIRFVRDDFCQQKGMHPTVGKGVVNGYMVWFTKDAQNKVDFTIQPTTLTMNENAIFALKQPANPQQVIGGAFLTLNMDEPGAIRLDLLGMARLDPYGSGNWELIRFQRVPATPKARKSSQRRLESEINDAE